MESPGIAFYVVSNPSTHEAIVEAITSTWPMIAIMFLLVTVAGTFFWLLVSIVFLYAEACPEKCQTSKMERFAKIVNSWKPLTIFAQRYILDVWQNSEYTFGMSLYVHIFVSKTLKSSYVGSLFSYSFKVMSFQVIYAEIETRHSFIYRTRLIKVLRNWISKIDVIGNDHINITRKRM